jgi:hypothetical protein
VAPTLQTSQSTPTHEYGPHSAGSIPSMNGLSTYPYPYTPSQPATAHPSTYQHYENPSYSHDWKPFGLDGIRPEDGKKPISRIGAPQPYGESVKRHLEFFDIEASLNEVGHLV